MTFSSSTAKRKPGTGSYSNNKHVWFHPERKVKLNSKPADDRGFIHFDSELEFSFYLSLPKALKDECFLHHPIELLPKPNQILWKVDFYFPVSKTIVEIKGDWILGKQASASKALFIYQCKLVSNLGFRLILIGNSSYKLDNFDVHSLGYFDASTL